MPVFMTLSLTLFQGDLHKSHKLCVISKFLSSFKLCVVVHGQDHTAFDELDVEVVQVVSTLSKTVQKK